MKKLFFLPIVLFAISCSNSKTDSTNKDSLSDSTATTKTDSLKKDVRKLGGEKSKDQILIDQAIAEMKSANDSCVGFWVGAFGHNRINIAITEVKDGKVSGYSVCAGNFRQLTGTEKIAGKGSFSFVLDEPGTDKYDGSFNFTINTATRKCTGAWAPFKKDATEPKNFTLDKTVFVYNVNWGIYPEASQRLLTKDDVENKMKDGLTMMRQEIYARHGYSFKNKDVRDRYDHMDGYVPMGVDIRDQLTDIEVKNINLIYTYETYLSDNYDDYGR